MMPTWVLQKQFHIILQFAFISRIFSHYLEVFDIEMSFNTLKRSSVTGGNFYIFKKFFKAFSLNEDRANKGVYQEAEKEIIWKNSQESEQVRVERIDFFLQWMWMTSESLLKSWNCSYVLCAVHTHSPLWWREFEATSSSSSHSSTHHTSIVLNDECLESHSNCF